MAYSFITNGEIDPDSPLTTGLFFKIRDNTDFGRNLTTGQFVAAGYENDSISDAKLFDVPGLTFKGKNTGGTGNPVNMSVAQAQALLGLGALAFVDFVDQAELASGAVHQAELNTGTGFVSGIGNHTLPGGEYGFYPQVTESSIFSPKSVVAHIAGLIPAVQGVYETTINLSSDIILPGTPMARQRFINSSPPYDIGDGEIPLFVFVEVDKEGAVVGTYVSEAPPWVYNGPTQTSPHFIGLDGSKQRFRKVIDRKGEDWFERYMDEDQEVEIYEITNDIVNADMDLIYHPFPDVRGKEDESDNTIVLIDPADTLKLLDLHNEGESISSLLHAKNLKISNSFITNRATPNVNVKIVPVKWR